jgi:nucleosome binding factor SPN SPT16 subunit
LFYLFKCYHSQEQEGIYNVLLSLQAELLNVLKDGSTARDAYQHAVSYIREKKPELEKNFVKNIGFGVCMPTFFDRAHGAQLLVDGYRVP